MPKGFDQLNYYEMLDIKPDAAAFEIRHAYTAAQQVYQAGSLASYSFFSGDERREILSLIEQAYQTLINEQARKNYNEELIRRGELDAETAASPAVKKPVSIFDINHGSSGMAALPGREALKDKILHSESIGAVLSQKEIYGLDLKKIRMELGVEIEHIAQLTKVRIDHLKNIEEDNMARLPAPVFLKGFMKSYLKCLCLEPVDEITGRYMDTVALISGK